MLSQITQIQQPKTLKYSTPLKNDKNNNPSFKSLGAMGTQALNFLNTSPKIIIIQLIYIFYCKRILD